MAIIIVFLMLASTLLAIVQTVHEDEGTARDTQLVQGGGLGMSPVQSTDQGGQGGMGRRLMMRTSISLTMPCPT